MRVDVAIISISFVYNSHIARNFAFDALVGLSLHFSFLFYFKSSFPHIVDRAANDFSLLIFLDMFVDESLLVSGLQAHRLSLFASRKLLAAHAILHRLLLLQHRVSLLCAIHALMSLIFIFQFLKFSENKNFFYCHKFMTQK